MLGEMKELEDELRKSHPGRCSSEANRNNPFPIASERVRKMRYLYWFPWRELYRILLSDCNESFGRLFLKLKIADRFILVQPLLVSALSVVERVQRIQELLPPLRAVRQ